MLHVCVVPEMHQVCCLVLCEACVVPVMETHGCYCCKAGGATLIENALACSDVNVCNFFNCNLRGVIEYDFLVVLVT